MRIDELYLREVGPFDELRFEFKPRVSEDLADIAILTGPNGCGKSTLLYAIASLFALGDERLVRPLLGRRCWSVKAMAAMRFGGWVVAGSPDRSTLVSNPFLSGASLGGFSQTTVGDAMNYYLPMPWHKHPLQGYADGLEHWQGLAAFRYSHAAFAYAGARSMEPAPVTAIAEPTEPPLQGSLAFSSNGQSERLAHWIALTDYKVAGALRDGDAAAAARYERSQRAIERAVSKVAGEEIRFIVRRDPLAVVLRIGRREVDFDVLPDGLKSILSWVADLLMRLERTPWVDDTPPLQRPFLLLLDEIDIHLHPTWQRRVLPLVQELFPRAQVIASSHSPFVVTSVADAWIYQFAVTDGKATLREVTCSKAGTSYMAALRSVFEVDQEFDEDTERKLQELRELRNRVLKGESPVETLRALAAELQARGPEVAEIASFELHQVERRLQAALPK